MAWSFRKSVSIGGLFRLNFSKGGVGASVGVRGARVSIDPRGRAAVNVGAGGVYARQSLGGGGRRQRKARGNMSVGLAAGVIAVVIIAFAMVWPSGAKNAAKPAAAAKPVFVPMVAPSAPASSVTTDRVTASTSITSPAKAPETWTDPVEPSAAVAGEWKLKEGGISGTASLGPPDRNGQSQSINAPKSKGQRVNVLDDPRFIPAASGQVWVPEYTRADGTKVKGYYRDR